MDSVSVLPVLLDGERKAAVNSNILGMEKAIAATPFDGDALIRSHDRVIRRLATKFLGSGVAIDDLIQEGRIALWTSAKTWSADGGASVWTLARKKVFSAMLTCASKRLAESHEALEEVSVEDNAEAAILIRECLSALDDEEQFAIRNFMEGETFKAIGLKMNRPEVYAFRVFRRAVETLRERAAE